MQNSDKNISNLNNIIDNKSYILDIPECESKKIFKSNSNYGSCNSADLVVCTGSKKGYIISACNVGTNISGTGPQSYGQYFQWGRNKGFNIDENGEILGGSSYNKIDFSSFNINNDIYPFIADNWNPSDNYFGWLSESEDVYKYDFWGYKSDKKGPCKNGYHVPTKNEWENLLLSRYAMGHVIDAKYAIEDLKLPMSGIITSNKMNLTVPGTVGEYWTLSNKLNHFTGNYYGLGETLYFRSGETNYLEMSSERNTHGLPVRCFKNEYTDESINDCETTDNKEIFNIKTSGCNSILYPVQNLNGAKNDIPYKCNGKWTIDVIGSNWESTCETGWEAVN